MRAHKALTSIAVPFLVFLAACSGGGGGDSTPALTSVALHETGQTTCSDGGGIVVACAGTGQDGDLKAGVAWPNPRFTGATADCVTDNLTGLMWMRAPNPTSVDWATALANANGLTLCGFSDWRLPNRKELRSLINHELADNAAALNASGFSNVQPAFYWSSTADKTGNLASLVIVVHMGQGFVGGTIGSASLRVWPVRAGQ